MHIIQRGNNRAPCFYAERDYRRYLQHLTELAARFRCAVHAYVLMTNHVHLLVTPEAGDGASLLMKHLGQRYVQYFNRTYGRTGTLWEGRFRSSLVQREGYALTCQRYIELNPVRAKMVQHPRDYAWSSYRVAAEHAFSSVIAPHPEYLALGDLPHERAVRYARLFPRELSPDELCQIRLAANGGFALGSPDFIRTLSTLTGRRVERLRGQTTSRGNAR